MVTGLTGPNQTLKEDVKGLGRQIQETEKRELGIYVEERKTHEKTGKINNQEPSKTRSWGVSRDTTLVLTAGI